MARSKTGPRRGRKDLIIEKEFASIGEVKLDHENDNILRVFRTQIGNKGTYDSFLLQIRTYGGITENGGGKSRNMIANVGISIPEIKKILKYMESQPDAGKIKY